MNLNKLGIITLSAVTLMSPVTTTILATSGDGDSSTDITYTVDSSYTWTIHSAISLNSSTTTGNVSVTQANVAADKEIVIKVKGSGTDGAFTMKDKDGNGSNEISYNVQNGNEAVQVNGTVLTFDTNDTATKTTTLSFALGSSNIKAGNYKGTLTYTATLNTKN